MPSTQRKNNALVESISGASNGAPFNVLHVENRLENSLAQSKVFWKITGYPKPVGVKPYYLSEDAAIEACPVGAWVERHCPKQGKVDVGWKSERNNGRFEYV